MKFWIKLLIGFLIVIVICFGIWAFFFKEDDEVKAYNRVCEYIDYKESLGLKEKILEVKALNYIGEEPSNIITDDTYTKKEIIRIRNWVMSSDIINTYDDVGTVTCYFDSYLVIEDTINKTMIELLPYLNNKIISTGILKSIDKNVNQCIAKAKDLGQTIQILKNCQGSIDGEGISYEVLLGNYNSFSSEYRELLRSSADLLLDMISCVKYHFGEVKCDTNFALIDSFARSLKVSMTVETKVEAFYLHDLHLVTEKLEKNKSNQNIFSDEFTEYDFLMSYNKLFNNYQNVLNQTFAKHNIEKKKIAKGENLSDVVTDAQQSLITTLNILGYVGE